MNKVRARLLKRPIEREDYVSQKPKTNPNFPLIDCGLGHSPLGYPREINAALRKITPRLINEYPEDPYARKLQESVRRRFGLTDHRDKDGNPISPIFFNGAGSYGLLAAILSDFVSHDAVRGGAQVIGYGPQFTNIALLADRAAIPYFPIQLELGSPMVDSIQALIDNRRKSRKEAVIYVDNPNNPTGDAVTQQMLSRLLQVTQNRDLVIIDEAYADLIDDQNSAIPLTEQFSNLIVLRSISKGIGLASPRLGYAVMSKDLGDVYRNFELVFTVDAITHLLSQVALNSQILAKFLPGIRAKTASLKTKLVEVLQANNVAVAPTHPSVSILMARGPEGFYGKLLEYGVSSEDGGTFKPTHAKMDDSIVRLRIPGNEANIHELDRRLKIIMDQR